MALEKDGDDELNRSCEKLDSTRRIKEERNIAHKMKRRQANSIGHILRRNGLLKDVIEGKIQRTRRRGGRRRKQLLDDIYENNRYWNLNAEPPGRPLWTARLGRTNEPIVRQTMSGMNAGPLSVMQNSNHGSSLMSITIQSIAKLRNFLINYEHIFLFIRMYGYSQTGITVIKKKLTALWLFQIVPSNLFKSIY